MVLVRIPVPGSPGTVPGSSSVLGHNLVCFQGILVVHTDPWAGRASGLGIGPGMRPCSLEGPEVLAHVTPEGHDLRQTASSLASGNVGSKAWVWAYLTGSHLEKTGQI